VWSFFDRIRPWIASAIIGLLASPGMGHTEEPITIGFSVALTGGLAPGGKSTLLAMQIWQDDINGRGGLLRRPK
jgi:branched-chain amino acid transport system substrate-binding protein